MSKKILVVDDEPDVVKVIATRLEAQNYAVQIALKPSKALSLVQTYRPDLIILDIMMPEMDGGDLVRELHKKESTKDIPVIFMSAAYTDNSYENYESKGVNVDGRAYPALGKPINIEKLLKIMDRLIPKI